MGGVHYFKQIHGFMLVPLISAGWKSLTIQLQLTSSSPKILFCHSCDESPASFTFAFLSEIHAEENWGKVRLHGLSLVHF